MEVGKSKEVESFVIRIGEIVQGKNYKKIVLQLPKQLLTISFDLISSLKKQFADRQFFILYDSLKQPCCNDILGAEHVNYDCLIHFGRACFSSPHFQNHYYIFPEGEVERAKQIVNLLNSGELVKSALANNIGYILVDQQYYELVKKQVHIDHEDIEILKLAYDANQQDQYLMFGYYSKPIRRTAKNILIVSDSLQEQSNQMGFLQKVGFALKSFHQKIGQTLFTLGEDEDKPLVQLKFNNMKRLMQRYSMISKLRQYQRFGVLVSNTGTSFVNSKVNRCKQILKKHNKKCFLFMMNNLNQVKLGNFPEIQVYVIISCFNNSLFSVKDFYKFVVTPNDLQIAFEKQNFDQFGFDLKAQKVIQPQEELKVIQQNLQSYQLQKKQNQQIALQNKIQTLDYYRQREYKGLNFSEKKEVKKMTKGKIGLAQQYTNLS